MQAAYVLARVQDCGRRDSSLMPSLELKIKRIVKADNILLTQPSKSSPNLMYGFRSWLYAVIIIRRSIS
jgi:hypothetical protein